ncbi:MAG: hypothetical protein RIQ79_1491 [Verrucomicrobiota bacterium]
MPSSHQRNSKLLLAACGLSGFAAVSLGALGAHALRDSLLARNTLDSWHTAANYQLAHSIAALALLLFARQQPAAAKLPQRIAAVWLVGGLLFSGSIYALALGGPKLLGPVTPLGGLAFLAGWIGVIVLAIKPSPATPSTNAP